MKAIRMKQPWAYFIVNGYKDIENRDWPTRFRGPVFIHAGKEEDKNFRVPHRTLWLPRIRELLDLPSSFDRGGIVGIATVTDCVTSSSSPWFIGKYGFVLKDARPLSFVPLRGQLGFFDVSEDIILKLLPYKEQGASTTPRLKPGACH